MFASIDIASKSKFRIHLVNFTIEGEVRNGEQRLGHFTHCFLISLAQVISLNGGVFRHAPRIPKKRATRISTTICGWKSVGQCAKQGVKNSYILRNRSFWSLKSL